METQEWLTQCKDWTKEDNVLFQKGKDSGTAMNPKTNQPYTMEDIKKLVQSLPY